MKILFDLFPIILFFVAYEFGSSQPDTALAILTAIGVELDSATKPGVFLATLVAIVATLGQIGWVWLRGRKVDAMLWVSLVLIVGLGGLTLFLHDETFIKWKPTILYVLFAGALVTGRLFWQRNFVRTILGQQIELPDPVWERLLWVWSGFFALLAAANLFVAYNYSTDTWVNFKLFGLMGLTLAFVVGIGFWLSQHIKEAPDA